MQMLCYKAAMLKCSSWTGNMLWPSSLSLTRYDLPGTTQHAMTRAALGCSIISDYSEDQHLCVDILIYLHVMLHGYAG